MQRYGTTVKDSVKKLHKVILNSRLVRKQAAIFFLKVIARWQVP